MKLHTDLLPEYFTIADSTNSHYTEPTNCFDFVDRNANNLLVTVGDSWTWGADLASQARLQHLFGNIASSKLNCDWLNLAQSGANNFFIAERVEELGRIVPALDYKKIYLICTFTETGRSFDSHHDRYIDYLAWFEQNSINEFLAFLNAECYNRICSVAKQYSMILRVGTNFVDPVGFPVDFAPWFRQLGIPCAISCCVGHTGASRLTSVQQFVQDQHSYKEWFSNLVTQSAHTDLVCKSNILHKAHPTSAGHQIWANCVLESIINE